MQDPLQKERALTKFILSKVEERLDEERQGLFEESLKYLTVENRDELKAELKALIPEPEDKETIDYDKILEYVVAEVSKKVDSLTIPKGEKGDKGDPGKPGKKGKDAVVDMVSIVESLLQNMPKMSTDKVTVDYLGIKEYIDKQVSKIKVQAPIMRNGGTNSLRQLTDVVLDGVTQDAQGNYILASTPTPWGSIPGHLPDQTDLVVELDSIKELSIAYAIAL